MPATGTISVSWWSTRSPGAMESPRGGGAVAGPTGLRSISAHVGNAYRRVRIGVGHPGLKDLVHGYVLNDFAKDERPWVEALCAIIADDAGLLAKGQDASFQNKVHLGMQAKGFDDSTGRDPPNGPEG